MAGNMCRQVVTLSCADQVGIVREISGALAGNEANIVESAQFTAPQGMFFMRVVFDCQADRLEDIRVSLAEVAEHIGMQWEVRNATQPMRTLLMVSKFGHCLNDLLFRLRGGTLPITVPAIVSNHEDFRDLAEFHGIPFHYLPITRETKAQQEAQIRQIVSDYDIELTVLARYMQVLSDDMCGFLHGRAINIHHSFLPSFKGAKPYHQAYERGVKLIGATAHYVTADLDEGPIIEQDVARAEHSLGPEELVDTGRDVECVVLARAVRLHAERRVFLSGRRTVVFR